MNFTPSYLVPRPYYQQVFILHSPKSISSRRSWVKMQQYSFCEFKLHSFEPRTSRNHSPQAKRRIISLSIRGSVFYFYMLTLLTIFVYQESWTHFWYCLQWKWRLNPNHVNITALIKCLFKAGNSKNSMNKDLVTTPFHLDPRLLRTREQRRIYLGVRGSITPPISFI